MIRAGVLRGGMIAALGLLASCGGGGGGSGGAPGTHTIAVSTPCAPEDAVRRYSARGLRAGHDIATQPIVQVRSNGATDTADSSTVVTAALVAGTGSAGAQLTGATTATAAAGIATFTNLGISLAGTNYQLRFTATGVTEATSSGFAVTAPPRRRTVTFNIDSSQDVHPISRFIYGMNGWDPTQRPKNLTLSRSGGNRMTAYNWETNDSNAGADYHNQNDTFLGGGTEPNGAVRPGLEAARAAGAGMIVTLPLIGYVAADHQGNLDVAGTVSNPAPNYLSTRFHQSLPRKGSAFAASPDTTDAFVYQDEYVHFLDGKYPGAFAAANNPIWISLDNEPDLWQSTHARLRGDTNPATQAGQTATYAEMIQRTTDYADAAKDVNAAALDLRPGELRLAGLLNLQDAPDAANRDFLEFYLDADDSAASHQPAIAWSTCSTCTGIRKRVAPASPIRWMAAASPTRTPTPPWSPRASRRRARLWDPTYTEKQLDHAVQHQRADPPAAAPRGQDRRPLPGHEAVDHRVQLRRRRPHLRRHRAGRRARGIRARGIRSRPPCGRWCRTTISSTAGFDMFRKFQWRERQLR